MQSVDSGESRIPRGEVRGKRPGMGGANGSRGSTRAHVFPLSLGGREGSAVSPPRIFCKIKPQFLGIPDTFTMF